MLCACSAVSVSACSDSFVVVFGDAILARFATGEVGELVAARVLVLLLFDGDVFSCSVISMRMNNCTELGEEEKSAFYCMARGILAEQDG